MNPFQERRRATGQMRASYGASPADHCHTWGSSSYGNQGKTAQTAEKKKVLIVRPAEMAEVNDLLAKAQQRGDHTGGTLTIAKATEGATAWAVEYGGRIVMAYAMRASGLTCWVVAAGGDLPGVDLTTAVLPVIEAQAKALGCTGLAVTTKRQGMVHKLKRAGWAEAAVTLRKTLT